MQAIIMSLGLPAGSEEIKWVGTYITSHQLAYYIYFFVWAWHECHLYIYIYIYTYIYTYIFIYMATFRLLRLVDLAWRRRRYPSERWIVHCFLFLSRNSVIQSPTSFKLCIRIYAFSNQDSIRNDHGRSHASHRKILFHFLEELDKERPLEEPR